MLAAEAKKAEEASITLLLIPSPPELTGRVASAHESVILLEMFFLSSSNPFKRKQGFVRRRYRSFGI